MKNPKSGTVAHICHPVSVRQRQQEHAGYTVKTMLGYIRPCLEKERGRKDSRKEEGRERSWACESKSTWPSLKFSGF